jgi:hypothetical protein
MRVQRVLAVAVVLLFLVSLGFGQTQGGVKPRVQIIWPDPVVIRGEFVCNCGDFNILNDYTLIVRKVFQVDKYGSPVKGVEHFSNSFSIYYNSEDPSISVAGEETAGLLKSDYDAMTMKVCGNPYKITAPGYGLIFHQVGCWTWDLNTWEVIDYKGPHDIFEGNMDGLCHLLRSHD